MNNILNYFYIVLKAKTLREKSRELFIRTWIKIRFEISNKKSFKEHNQKYIIFVDSG